MVWEYLKVVHLIAGLAKGGAETALVNLVKYQSKNNEIKYTIISLSCFHYYEDEIRQLGCELIETDILRHPIKSLRVIGQHMKACDLFCSWMYYSNLLSYYVAKITSSRNLLWFVRHADLSRENLMPLMIKIGRIQCMIIGLLVTGFIAVGKSFIVDIWNKPDFVQSYFCAILLILPSYFYLPMQIANTTLIVENKINVRAYVFTVVGIVNVCLSLIFSKYWGAIGASVSIFVAYMLRALLMAIMYKVVLKFDMWLFFKETFLKITPFLLIAMGVGLGLEHFNPMAHSFLRFALNGGVFVATFAVLMLLFGLNQYEKNLFFGILKKL